jgi:hypothetical protein
MKAQKVRLFDVFVLGPAMVWAGYQLAPKPIGKLISLAGLGTIAYNWENYQRVRKTEKS